MRNTLCQTPQLRLDLFASNKLAVPRLGNVRLGLHFLRRGTSGAKGIYMLHIATLSGVLVSKIIVQ